MWKIIVGVILIGIGSFELYLINEEAKAAAWDYHDRKARLFFSVLIIGGLFLIYKFSKDKFSKNSH